MKKQLLLLGWSLSFAQAASAMAVDWAGTYRFEYTEIDKTTLAPGGGRKAYALSHLNLSPKIIAADGVNIVANFEVLGNANYPNSQVGQQFGSGVNAGTATGMSGNSSNVASQNQGASNLQVRELYANFNQEYGSIVVGRAPLQFGLGMTYNAGKGAFDHWGDVSDMVGYKFLIGNLSFMPMIGKPYDHSPAQGRDVTDTMFNVEYNNPETESVFGLFYRTRTSSLTSNDAFNVYDATVNPAYTNTTAASGWSTNHTNITLMRGWESFKFRMEAGFDSGTTGINTAANNEIKINGYGIAVELEFPKTDWKWLVKAGMASGDNPTTDNYEGYSFDRNYDVAFMMFNHPMGGYDVLTTNAQRNRSTACTTAPCPLYANEEALDEDAIGNTVFLSPRFTISFGDKLDWRNTLTYAQIQTNSSRVVGNDTAKDLGFEWDTALIYRPYERVQWVNEIGFFAPGSAYKEGSVGRDAGFNYGFQSKAAISF